VASQEENSNTGESSPSALFSKFGGSFFGAAAGSPQKVVTNIRGFLSNRLPGAISIPSDTGESRVLSHYVTVNLFSFFPFVRTRSLSFFGWLVGCSVRRRKIAEIYSLKKIFLSFLI
jgi:hypothetical protein